MLKKGSLPYVDVAVGQCARYHVPAKIGNTDIVEVWITLQQGREEFVAGGTVHGLHRRQAGQGGEKSFGPGDQVVLIHGHGVCRRQIFLVDRIVGQLLVFPEGIEHNRQDRNNGQQGHEKNAEVQTRPTKSLDQFPHRSPNPRDLGAPRQDSRLLPYSRPFSSNPPDDCATIHNVSPARPSNLSTRSARGKYEKKLNRHRARGRIVSQFSQCPGGEGKKATWTYWKSGIFRWYSIPFTAGFTPSGA